MDFEYSVEQQKRRDAIIAFAHKSLNEDVVARDKGQVFRHDLWLECGEMGLQGLPVPPVYGGGGLDPLSTALALEALGYGCHDGGLVFAIGAHLLAGVVPIWLYGTETQRRRYLPDLCAGRRIITNAFTETEAGSDRGRIQTRAVPDGSGYRLSGSKVMGTNAPVADVALVYAVTEASAGVLGQQTAFLVELDQKGVTRGAAMEMMGLRTAPVGELAFADVYVPAENVLGSVGAGAVQFGESMNWERIGLFASHVGVLSRLLERCVRRAREREQFGQPIGKFQAVSHSIADMKVALEAARLLTYRAAQRLDLSRSVTLDAAMAKLFVSESLIKAAIATIQVFGGYGYLTAYEVERLCRDALASTIYSGTSAMQRNLIARWLGL